MSITVIFATRPQSFDTCFLAAETTGDRLTREFLEGECRVEEVSMALGRFFRLPKEVTLQFGGDLGPLYDPVSSSITIPYHFVARLRRAFPDAGDAVDLTRFILYHEVGHALIDQLELPVPGGSEESADALATLISIEWVDSGGGPVLAASRLFARSDVNLTLHPWFDSGLDLERSRRLICWIVGSDPGRLEWLAEDAGISPSNADRCPTEFEELRQRWLELVSPYLRQ
jgi:hypothetical protein